MIRLLPISLLLACSGERPTDIDTDTDTEDPAPECLEDVDCSRTSICEADACIEGDRDNSFADARRILQNDPATGVIVPAGDVDYYAYTTPSPEWLRIHTITDEADLGGLNTVVAVYNESGALHAWVDDYATGTVSTYDSLLYVYLPTAGTWYVTVEDRSSFFDTGAIQGNENWTYELVLTGFAATTRENDSAQTPSLTADMTSGRSTWAVGVVLETPGDADYIAVNMPWGDAPFEIWGNQGLPGSDAITRVRAYDTAGELLLQKDRVGPEGAAIYFDGQHTTYTVEVTDALGGGGDTFWTVLYFRTRDAGSSVWPPENEPNDSLETAELLPQPDLTTSGGTPYRGAYVRGALEAQGDEDFFQIEIRPAELLSVRCTGESAGSLTDLALDVLDANGVLLETVSSGDDSTPDVFNLGPYDPGEYTLRVWSEDEVFGLGAYYRCSIFMTLFEVAP